MPTCEVQSGASSLAKHGGAYFSAVYGFIQDPIAAPGLFDIQVRQILVGIASAPTLFTTSTKHLQNTMVPVDVDGQICQFCSQGFVP